jgi:hypothetical protein
LPKGYSVVICFQNVFLVLCLTTYPQSKRVAVRV